MTDLFKAERAPEQYNPSFLENQLRRIEECFAAQEQSSLRFIPQSIAPAKPRNGLICAADGTNWDPGQGAGMYAYTNGDWLLLALDPVVISGLETAISELATVISGLGTAATRDTGTASGEVPLVGTTSATETLAGLMEIANTTEVGGAHTTGTITTGTASLVVASATGIVTGMKVVGEGIVPGTTVEGVSGTTVTISQNAVATLSGDPVAFYKNQVALTPASVGGMLCRAWVQFNGTGTVAIQGAFNVASITDNGTGNYTVTFATEMPDAKYSVVTACTGASGTTRSGNVAGVASLGTASFVVLTQQGASDTASGGAADFAIITVAVFR